jgi:hypothetical protein
MVENRNNNQKSPIVIIACQVFQTLIEKLLPRNLTDQVIFLDYGLHVQPKKMVGELQSLIDQIENPSLVILVYGLCGNGLVGVNSGDHTIIIPKTDDCIAILLGSNDLYHEVFTSEPGTYYLTKGWLESGSNPLKEYKDYVGRYGKEKAEMIMDTQYKNYTRLMFVAHSQEDVETYRNQVKEIATYCQRWDMRYEERLGSDQYIKNLITMAEEFSIKGIENINSELRKDFVIIQPNTFVEQMVFLR